MSVNPDKLLKAVCPDGATVTTHKSSGVIGTAYGKYLGVCYMRELQMKGQPKTYGIVDFDVFTGAANWEPGNIFTLAEVDQYVAGALTVSEWTRGWRKRTDILNADTDEVFEIKPLGSRDDGPKQLENYLKWLQAMAPKTDPRWGVERNRTWRGGMWDPSRYPLVIGGFGGQKVCVLHAWRDPAVQGLIVYDIKCCQAPTNEKPELRAAKVTNVVKEIEPQMRPAFEEMVLKTMPLAEAGARYAILTSERYFETFVKGAWDRKIDALHDRYGPQPGPALKKFMLDSMILQHFVTGGLGTIVIAYSGFLPAEQAEQWVQFTIKHWGVGLAVGVVVGLVCFGAPGVVAAVAAGAEWTAAAGLTAEIAAGMATGTVVAANALPRVASVLPTAPRLLLNGSSALLQVGRAAAERTLGSVDPGQIAAGLGVLGAFIYAVLPGEADAASAGSPATVAQVAAIELPLLAPVELLEPVGSNRIEAGSFVRCGGEKYFVPAIVRAD